MSDDSWLNAIVSSKMVDPNTLTGNPMNWRLHSQNQFKALEGLLDEVGWVERILVNKRTGHIVDGHARVELAVKRGEKKVPVDYIDVDEEKEKLILATLDPIAAMANTDADMLAELIESLATDIDDLLGDYRPGVFIEGNQPEWTDMPEFDQKDETAHRSIIMHFANDEDLNEFLEKIGKTVTEKTKFIWYPQTPETDMGSLKYE